jgi:aryl-alcohol dehydrogenase-like predicted oxidoreductase
MLEQQIDRSLKRLQTDSVDLLQLHSCSKDLLEKGDVIRVLEKARDAGKTRFIGYSGDGEDARSAINTGRFDTLQTSINIADQEALRLTLPLAQDKQMGVIAKRPIANAAWRTGSRPQDAYHQPYWDRLQKLNYEFLKEQLSDSISIALRFTLACPGVSTAIVGTTNPDRWSENAKFLEAGALSPEEYEMIRDRWDEVAEPDWVGQT